MTKASGRILPFQSVLADETGGNVKTQQADYQATGQYPIVDQGKALIAGYTNDPRRLCKACLPVIVFGDHTRSFKFVDFPFCLGADGTKILRPRIEADEKYLFHYLRQVRIADGGYDRHFKYLKRAEIWLPSLEDQRRIAAILDQADGLRGKRRKALGQVNCLAKAVFQEMFGDVRDSSKVNLADVCFLIRDGTHVTPEYVYSGIPFVTVKNIVSGTLDLSETKFITPETHLMLIKSVKPENGDILVSKDGTIGVPCPIVTEVEFSIFVSVALLKLKHELIDQTFLTVQLAMPAIQKQIRERTKGIAIRHLHLEDFRTLEILLPPIDEQRLFAKRVSEIQSVQRLYHEHLSKLDALFASLQHRAFRGELTSERSAGELAMAAV